MPVRYVPATNLAPGVVCRDVVCTWIAKPLWLLRPNEGDMEARRPAHEDTARPAAFSDDEDGMVAAGKRRPALIIAGRWELRAVGGVRVVPIHSRSDKKFYVNNWPKIIAGRMAGLIHMPADARFDFAEGVLDLTATYKVPRAFLPPRPWFSLDPTSIVGVHAAIEDLGRQMLTGLPS